MNQESTKELAQKLMKIKGETRGVTLKSDREVILRKKGKEGLSKLETMMAELGFPIKYEEIRTMDFYPIGLDVLSVLTIKEVFNLDEKQLEELGATAVKFSLFLKIWMRYFFSIRLLAKEAPKMWRRHYTVGELEVSETNEKEKYAVLKLKNFALHPAYCVTLRGYFSKILQIAVKSPVICEEIKCTFKGDEYHEYLIKWK